MSDEPKNYAGLQGYLDDLVQAAIDADMEHRHWRKVSDDRWVDEFSGLTSVVREGDTITFHNPRAGGRGGVDPDAIEESQQQIAQTLADEVFDYYPEEVQDAFDPWFGIPEPSGFDDDSSALAAGAVRIRQNAGSAGDGGSGGNATLQGDLDNVHGVLTNMKGRAAKAFGQDWMAYLPGVLDNDHLALATLGFAMEADRAVIQAARDDITSIAQQGITAMESSGPISPEFDGLTVALTLVAGIATGIAAVPSFGVAPVAFTAALGAAGAATAETILGSRSTEERKDVELGAAHPKDVLTNIKNAIEDAREASRTEEEDIRAVLIDVTNATYDPGQYDMSRPHLLNVRKAPIIIDEDEIQVTAADVDRIVDTWMPNIADCIEDARAGLASSSSPWQRPYQIGLGPTGPYAQYATLEERMQDVLSETADEVRQAAHHLDLAAGHIGDADGAANRALDQHSDRLDEIERQEELAEQRERERPRHIQPPGGLTPF